ncbi:alpha/beta hydrolase [Plantactinospora sp. WMMB334]|uniref:alpha/beta hydrolase n=1 Tax=Plantactinospora sp. WMMB334 TaxID=3404119 RepID=UPI003B951CB7
MARSHPRRLALAGFLAVVVLTAGCTIPLFRPDAGDEPGGAGAPANGAGADWQPCPEVPRELVGRTAPNMRYECATISVPDDWAAAGAAGTGGGKLEISLLRIRSSKQRDRIGSLLINPGGPGGSGVDAAVYLSFGSSFGGLPDEVTRRFDIIGFDPRGVSRSSPVKCVSDADLDRAFGFEPDPDDQAEFDELVALNRTIGDACGARYGERLRLFSTEQAAHDMDAIRAAVGDEKLSYLGYSYGTLLGATYAQLFPRNVRALVLDGAVDPEQDIVAGSESQAKGFERAFTNFTAWCAGNPGRCPISPDARGAVTDALEKARVSPVRGDGGREATAGWVFYAVISSLYTEAGWQKLAAAIDSLAKGDPEEVFELADSYAERGEDGRYTNLFDANLAVNCADEENRVGVDRIRSLQTEWRTKYPLFGAPLAVGMLSCEFWPAQRDPYPTGPATGAPPIVVVGTTGDPATPYEQTPKLAGMLDVGVVLTWQGEGHTAYPQTRCITDAVDKYLIELKPPSAGTTCPAR